MIRSRPVAPRASRIAWYVASEPLLQTTTCSADGTCSTILRASSTSASVTPTPNSTVSSIARATRSVTAGWLWPRKIAP